MKARKIVDEMDSYVPGRSQDEIAKDFNLKKEDIIKLGSNENPWGPSPKAMEAIKQSVSSENKEVMTTTNVINIVCNFYNITKNDLIGKKRNKEIVEPRQICMYLMTELLSIPLMTIGQAMGGRDHTTVIHARDKVSELIKTNSRVATEVSDLKNLILKK